MAHEIVESVSHETIRRMLENGMTRRKLDAAPGASANP